MSCEQIRIKNNAAICDESVCATLLIESFGGCMGTNHHRYLRQVFYLSLWLIKTTHSNIKAFLACNTCLVCQ